MVLWKDVVVLVSLGVVLVSPLAVHARRKDSLFEFIDQVTELNPESFSDAAASSVPWVLDCYSPGCPHCVRFAPTWEKVGTALRDSPVHVGAINCMKHHDLCHSLHVPSYPTLMALNSPSVPPGTASEPAVKIIKKGVKTFEGVIDLIRAEFPSAPEGVTAAGGDVTIARELEQGGKMDRLGGMGAPCVLRIEDAVMSVRFVLIYEVFTSGNELTEERMTALLAFLDLLATTFPGRSNRTSFRSLANDLRRDPRLNNFSRWKNRISNFAIGSFAPSDEGNWPAANFEKGTEANALHYTSGLWSLLHALSVSSAPTRQNPYEVMEGIRSFVDNFFRCEVCRSHFLEMYRACDNGRCDIPKPSNIRGQQMLEGESALALWLWRAHNTVNARLAQERDEEPQKSFWPSAEACNECRRGPSPQNEKEDGEQEQKQPTWSETEVLKVLKRTFSCPEAEEAVGEGPGASGSTWALYGVLICTVAAVLMWAPRWVKMRGVGLSKKREGGPAPAFYLSLD